jgi:hypothetical protein
MPWEQSRGSVEQSLEGVGNSSMKAIRSARPQRLYVAADGPRADKVGETERYAELHRLATEVDWPCEVRSLFRERNLGGRNPISSRRWLAAAVARFRVSGCAGEPRPGPCWACNGKS